MELVHSCAGPPFFLLLPPLYTAVHGPLGRHREHIRATELNELLEPLLVQVAAVRRKQLAAALMDLALALWIGKLAQQSVSESTNGAQELVVTHCVDLMIETIGMEAKVLPGYEFFHLFLRVARHAPFLIMRYRYNSMHLVPVQWTLSTSERDEQALLCPVAPTKVA